MKFQRRALLLITIAAAAVLIGCGNSSSGAPAVTVAFTSGFTPPTSMVALATAGIAATVTNDPDNEGVNWSVTCSGVTCGSFSPGTTPSTVPTTYTAPSAAGTVTVTATSVYDSTKFVSANISITEGAAITVTLTPPVRASMNVSSTAPFTAVVDHDPQNGGVDWSVTCGSPACGSFTESATDSSVPTTYMAPGSVPTNGTVTVTATSVTDPNVFASATVDITSAPTTLPDGSYVFHLSGTDNTAKNGESPYFLVGVFTVSGGVITYGEQDFHDHFTSVFTIMNSPNFFTTAPTPDGNLQITINTNDPTLPVGVNGILTLHATIVNSIHVVINEFDTFATGSGAIDLQTSTALPPVQGYAFFASGVDSTEASLAFGGIFNVDSTGSISGNGSILDVNDAAVGPLPDQTLGQSAVSQFDAFGRVAIGLNPSNPEIAPIAFIGYVVNANTIQFLEPPDNYGGLTGGTALGQGANTGEFSNATLSGLNYVIGAQGTEGSNPRGPLQLAGLLTFNSNLSLAGNVTIDDIFNAGSGAITGNYAVDSTGRVTISNLAVEGTGAETLQLYLDGSSNALAVSMDTIDVTAGVAHQQSPGAAFSGSYALSADGVVPPNGGGVTGALPWGAVGSVVTNASGSITGFIDSNILGASNPTNANVQLYGTAAGSSQPLTGTLTGLGGVTTPGNFNYYVIDSNRVIGIESDVLDLSLVFFEQISN